MVAQECTVRSCTRSLALVARICSISAESQGAMCGASGGAPKHVASAAIDSRIVPHCARRTLEGEVKMRRPLEVLEGQAAACS